MSIISRLTTWTIGQVLKAADLNGEFSNITNLLNNLDAGTTSWTTVKTGALTVTGAPTFTNNFYSYRRPVLQYGSATTVAVESGLDGTSGDIPLLFPDGTIRTETSTTRTTLNTTRNAVLTTSGAQSGMTGATTVAASTWYSLYGVKVTDSTTQWVSIASTVIPTQANFATLNTAYGTNGWVYLGTFRYGDNAGATGVVLDFVQIGNYTMFKNVMTGNAGENTRGTRLATTAGATSISYTYAAGTGAAQIPAHLTQVIYGCVIGTNPGASDVANQAGTLLWFRFNIATRFFHFTPLCPAVEGYQTACTNSQGQDIVLAGFSDSVLGVGLNPLF